MTVGELMNRLKELPEDAPVLFFNHVDFYSADDIDGPDTEGDVIIEGGWYC